MHWLHLPLQTSLTKVCTIYFYFNIVLQANGFPWADSFNDDHQTGPSIDDIKIEYHPHSERPPEVLPLKDYQERRRNIKIPKLKTHQPWKPFKSRAEFEYAEIALKVGLSKNQSDTLIALMKRCIRGEETFTLDSHAHLCEIWNDGAILHTAVSTPRFVCT